MYRPENPAPAPSVNVQVAETKLVSDRPMLTIKKARDEFISKVESPDLGDSLKAITISEGVDLARRPGYGTTGQEFPLRANFFEVVPKKNLRLYRYNIAIHDSKNKPVEKVPARKSKRLFKLLIDSWPPLKDVRPAIATDYRSLLITAKPLDFKENGDEWKVTYFEEEESGPNPDRPDDYIFSFKVDSVVLVQSLLNYLASTDIGAIVDNKEVIIQTLNIIMARTPSMRPHTTSSTATNKYFPIDIGFLGGIYGGLGKHLH